MCEKDYLFGVNCYGMQQCSGKSSMFCCKFDIKSKEKEEWNWFKWKWFVVENVHNVNNVRWIGKFVVIDFLSTSDFSLFFPTLFFQGFSRRWMSILHINNWWFCILMLFHFTLKQIHYLLSELYDHGYEENRVKVIKVLWFRTPFRGS